MVRVLHGTQNNNLRPRDYALTVEEVPEDLVDYSIILGVQIVDLTSFSSDLIVCFL